MPAVQTDAITMALTDALETMTFISPMPAEEPVAPPVEPWLISIEFALPNPGRLDLVAPRGLGQAMAANLLGTGPDDPDAAVAAEDSLRELVNVVCGSLLHNLLDPGAPIPQISLPRLTPFDLAQWEGFARDAAAVLDAEGHTIAIAVKGLA